MIEDLLPKEVHEDLLALDLYLSSGSLLSGWSIHTGAQYFVDGGSAQSNTGAKGPYVSLGFPPGAASYWTYGIPIP